MNEQTPDIEALTAVLGGHRFARPISENTVWCVCLQWSIARTEDGLADERAYEAHVAQAVAPVLAAAVREAEQRALREAAGDLECPPHLRHGNEVGCHACMKAQWLRDRADRVAVDAPEGGEGR